MYYLVIIAFVLKSILTKENGVEPLIWHPDFANSQSQNYIKYSNIYCQLVSLYISEFH